jgi:O-antigen/teichoic acid export membrane protein
MLKKIVYKIIYSPTIMSWTQQIAAIAHGLVITSIILVKFNNDSYAFWMTIKVLMELALLADVGFSHTLQRSVAFFFEGAKRLPRNIRDYEKSVETSGEPNTERLQALLYTSRGIYLILSGLTIIIISTIGTATLWNLFTIGHHSKEFWITYLLMILQTFILIQSIKWKSFVKGIRQVALFARVNTIMNVLRIFVFLVILLKNKGMLYLQSYLVLESVFTAYYFRDYTIKWFKNNGIRIFRSYKIDNEIFRSLWSVSWKSGLNHIGYFCTNKGISLLIAQIKNTGLMSGFFFTYQVLGFIKNFALTPVFVHYPEYYSLIAVKKFNELKKDARVRIFLTVVIITGGFLAFGLFGNPLLRLMGTDKRLVETIIYVILSLYLFFDLHALIHGTFYISTNDVPFLIPGLITGAVTVGVGYLVIPEYGLLGLVLVQFLANLACNFWFSTYLSLKLVRWPFLVYLNDVFIEGYRYWLNRLSVTMKKLSNR